MLHTVYLQVPPIGEYFQLANSEGFPGGSVVKILASNSGVTGDVSQSLGQEHPWSGKWQPTSVFLPGKSDGQRSLANYSPWGHKELVMTEHAHACTQ